MGAGESSQPAYPAEFLDELIQGGLRWLIEHPNPDGGWGDTDKSHSNIATTMLVVAAFELAGATGAHQSLIDAANAFDLLRERDTSNSFLHCWLIILD